MSWLIFFRLCLIFFSFPPLLPVIHMNNAADYPDDVIGPSLCKALEKTYASMPEYVEKGWLSPLPSEWKCQPQQ